MESSLHLEDQEETAGGNGTSMSDAGESPLESVIQPACTSESSDSSGKRKRKKSPKKQEKTKELIFSVRNSRILEKIR